MPPVCREVNTGLYLGKQIRKASQRRWQKSSLGRRKAGTHSLHYFLLFLPPGHWGILSLYRRDTKTIHVHFNEKLDFNEILVCLFFSCWSLEREWLVQDYQQIKLVDKNDLYCCLLLTLTYFRGQIKNKCQHRKMNKSYSPNAPTPPKKETNNNFKKLCEGRNRKRKGGKITWHHYGLFFHRKDKEEKKRTRVLQRIAP